MQTDLLQEARRQAEICNACRYCEGYCSVFPALHAERAFSDGDLTQLANLCHNCRGCYYACQYTAPHEFDLNLPQALANVRQDSWEDLAFPRAAGKAFQKSGVMIALAAVIGFALLFWAARALATQGGEGFYAVLSHNAMVAIFLPAFLFPLFSIAISLRRYWRQVGAQQLKAVHLVRAFGQAANMRNLKGGHGDGCNFEDEDRFSHTRRMAHQAVMYGFLLCFASTSVATVMHYVLNMSAPYPLWSLPKLLGVSGGLRRDGPAETARRHFAGCAGGFWRRDRFCRVVGLCRSVWACALYSWPDGCDACLAGAASGFGSGPVPADAFYQDGARVLQACRAGC